MQITYNLIICVKRAGDLMLHMLIFFLIIKYYVGIKFKNTIRD